MLLGKHFTVFSQSFLLLVFWGLLYSVQASQEKKRRFDGDQVLQVTPKTEEDVKYLKNLFLNENDFKLDFWTNPREPDKPVDIHVPHSTMKKFKDALNTRSIRFRVKISNLQQQIDEESKGIGGLRTGSFNLKYHWYSEIVQELRRLERHYENLVKVFSLGKTYQKYTMYGIRLVLKYSTDPSVKHLVDKLEWIIVPVVNADGYNYSRTINRMWRKNRRPTPTNCTGTDLNRNFNIRWGTGGEGIGKPCSDFYPGERPFSDPEVRNLVRYMYTIKQRIKGYVDVHSYGQLLMAPWGYTKTRPPTYSKNRNAMLKMAKAIWTISGNDYFYGSISRFFDYVSGDTATWVYDVLGVTHSYALELQPIFFDRQYGFVLPPFYIVPVGMEAFAGLKALAEII